MTAAPRKKRNEPPRRSPLHVIERAKQAGIREVLVAYSCGKDSAATLDLCVKHFDRVVPFFMYVVKGLSFQEIYLRHIEQRYGLEILRVPHWQLANIFKGGAFRHFTKQSQKVRQTKIRSLEHWLRKQTGLHWVASGETVYESLQRRGMIQGCDGIGNDRGHIYPIAYWRKQDVNSYLSMQNIPLPPEYSVTLDGRSFGGLRMEQIAPIAERYPEDFAKIKRLFPLIGAQVTRWRIENERRQQKDQASDVRHSGDAPHGAEEVAVQSEADQADQSLAAEEGASEARTS